MSGNWALSLTIAVVTSLGLVVAVPYAQTAVHSAAVEPRALAARSVVVRPIGRVPSGCRAGGLGGRPVDLSSVIESRNYSSVADNRPDVPFHEASADPEPDPKLCSL